MWKVLKKAVSQENKLNSIDQIQFNQTTITDNKETADVCNQHLLLLVKGLPVRYQVPVTFPMIISQEFSLNLCLSPLLRLGFFK